MGLKSKKNPEMVIMEPQKEDHGINCLWSTYYVPDVWNIVSGVWNMGVNKSKKLCPPSYQDSDPVWCVREAT